MNNIPELCEDQSKAKEVMLAAVLTNQYDLIPKNEDEEEEVTGHFIHINEALK